MGKVWVILMVVYSAPQNAVDWNGPWQRGMTVAGKDFFNTEGECRNEGVAWIGRVHSGGMLAPARFQCVSFPATLPAGAPR